jgi:regulator of ribonuclease activity A
VRRILSRLASLLQRAPAVVSSVSQYTEVFSKTGHPALKLSLLTSKRAKRCGERSLVNFKTADLCDEFESLVQVAEPLFRDYGGLTSFCGQIATVRVFEDNVLVREAVETDGRRRVLVVDGGASMRCALLGDRLAQIACDNDWTGIVLNGCIRDSVEISGIPLGIRALGAVPKKSGKERIGKCGVAARFAGVTFTPGQYLYADADGILVSNHDLLG